MVKEAGHRKRRELGICRCDATEGFLDGTCKQWGIQKKNRIKK